MNDATTFLQYRKMQRINDRIAGLSFRQRSKTAAWPGSNWAVDCKSGLERDVLRASFAQRRRRLHQLDRFYFPLWAAAASWKERRTRMSEWVRERDCFALAAIRPSSLIAPANWPNSRYVLWQLYNLFRVVGNLIVLAKAIFRARSRDGFLLPLRNWLEKTNAGFRVFFYFMSYIYNRERGVWFIFSPLRQVSVIERSVWEMHSKMCNKDQ